MSRTQKTKRAALPQKFRITIPGCIREYLCLAPGKRIVPDVSMLDDNLAKVVPRTKPEDFRQIREEFEKGVGVEAGEES